MHAGGELVHVMSFLLQMGFMEVGVPFPLLGLDPLQANIAAHLAQLGLLMPFRWEGLLLVAAFWLLQHLSSRQTCNHIMRPQKLRTLFSIDLTV